MGKAAENSEVTQLREEFQALHNARLAAIARMREWQIQTYGTACEIYPRCICELELQGRCAIHVAREDAAKRW